MLIIIVQGVVKIVELKLVGRVFVREKTRKVNFLPGLSVMDFTPFIIVKVRKIRFFFDFIKLNGETFSRPKG